MYENRRKRSKLKGNYAKQRNETFFSVSRNNSKHFFRIFVLFSVLRNDRNSAKQCSVSYSFVFRETKKIRNCQPYSQLPDCLTEQAGGEIGWANVWKTQLGCCPFSYKYIFFGCRISNIEMLKLVQNRISSVIYIQAYLITAEVPCTFCLTFLFLLSVDLLF